MGTEEPAMSLSSQDLRAPGRMAATLGYSAYAEILASTISTLETPANVGIFAGWGCGKSHLLNNIKDILHDRSEGYPTTSGFLKCVKLLWYIVFFNPPEALKRSNEVRFISVYFNALEYAGSDHLWAGLVTRLVGSVEFGIGRLPSAIFRANSPRRMPLRFLTSSKPEKIRFESKKLCESKIPVYFLFIAVLIVCIALGISLLVFALNKQARLIKESEGEYNASNADSSLLDSDTKKSSLALGTIIISIPFVAVCKNAIPVVVKVINTHQAHIKKILSRPDFSKELGVMAKIKGEIMHLSRLVRFMELFEQRRIVVAIFIDDLDKLPQQNIAPLLQAIKILLSDPTSRFVSILAIDPYSVSDALEMGIQSEFPAINISGHRFLKQMIQVPFSIPAMNNEEKAVLFQALEKRGRLSQSEDSNDVPDGPAPGKAMTSTREMTAKQGDGDKDPLLGNTSGGTCKQDVIPMAEITKEKAEKPLDEHDTVVSACECVMSELRNPEIFPFIANNLQEMLRLVGIVKVTTRVLFCRIGKPNPLPKSDPEAPYGIMPLNLAAWVVLVGQWPYRTTWMIQQVEDRDDAESPYSRCTTLHRVYKDTECNFTLVTSWRKLIQLDGDPDDLESFLEKHSGWLNVGFLYKLLPHTISLDRSLKSIVAWTSVERDLKTHGVFSSKPLSHMDVSDVISLIKSSCKDSKRLDEYAGKCMEHNISGMVLLRGDMEEVKECLEMNLGDWTLFYHTVLQLKTVHRFKFST